MLSTLTPEGVQTLKSNPQRIREVNKEIEQLGATVTAQWAVLGRYDDAISVYTTLQSQYQGDPNLRLEIENLRVEKFTSKFKRVAKK